MSSLFSPNWYRVAALKPRLRGHFEVHRQPFRSELTFLLQDHSTGKFFHFNANAYDIIGRMDGELTVHDMWEAALDCLGDDAPTQDETIALLGRLHQVDALQVDVSPDTIELLRRARRVKSDKWRRLLTSPLALRLPLIDPDRLLQFLLPSIGPLFSRAGLVIWLLVVGWALVLAAEHWPELTFEVSEQLFNIGNLALLALVYPVIKLCHELGHAITTKKWGGEVHEIGITFLVLVPVPYVDATAASAIRNKYQRMLVSAAGMAVELFLAAIALFVWLNVEPGVIRLVAFDVMLIGCVSTLLFNGNPLLRFDGYYILKDMIEIPNLASRASKYLIYLMQRYLLNMKDLKSPSSLPGERKWLFFYGVGSAVYRIFITFAIILLIAGEYFVIGVLLALWAFTTQIVMPLVRATNFVLFDTRLARHRFRAVAVTGMLLTSIGGFLFLAPVPSSSRAEGVLWLPEQAYVQTSIDGTVKGLLVEPFAVVRAGQPLIELEDPFLTARIQILESELEELRLRQRREGLATSQGSVFQEQANAKQAELDHDRQRAAELIVKSGADGIFVLRQPDDLPGKLLHQGDRVGFVLDESSLIVRVVVPQDRIGLVRESLVAVEVKLAEALHQNLTANVSRGVPSAQSLLPSRALGSAGGGSILIDPKDNDGITPASPIFQLDLTFEEEPDAWHLGQRAFVRFDHGSLPLARQWLRTGRQLFLRRFGV